jgi:methyl-accepting chemotaxis protein
MLSFRAGYFESSRANVDLPTELLQAQLRSVARSYPTTAAATVLVTGSLLWSTTELPNYRWVLTGATLHLAITMIKLSRWGHQRRLGWRVVDPVARTRTINAEAAAVALGWFVFLSLAGADARPEEQVLITTVMAGVMAVGALRYAAIPSAGLIFLCTGAAVCAAYSFISSISWSVYFCLGVFVLMLARTVLAQASVFKSQYDAGAELARTATERDLLAAKSREEMAQTQLRDNEKRVCQQREAEEARRSAVSNIAHHLERTILEAVTDLASAAEQTRGSATALAARSAEAHCEVLDVVARADKTHAGAAHLRRVSEDLHRTLTAMESRVLEQEATTKRVQALAFDADDKFGTLVRCTGGIEAIVDAISLIAARTDLLALNACIEAARAGDAGKGFAVVAGEVKELAAQTARATSQVRNQINEISEAVASTASIVRDMCSSFELVKELSALVVQAMGGQGAAIETIRDYADVAKSVARDLQDSTAKAKIAAEDAAGLTTELDTTTSRLLLTARDLAGQTGQFVIELKAA